MPWLRSLRSAGYGIHLLYFWLESPELAIERVVNRVETGGHHVPDATIRQRYRRRIRNFFDLYQPLANTWKVYDNSDGYRLIAEGETTEVKVVHDAMIWQRIGHGAKDV